MAGEINLPPGYELDEEPGMNLPPGYVLDEAPTATEAAARGALRNFPLAQQAVAAIAPINPLSEKKTYGEELQHLTQEAEIAKQAHPIAYGTGAVAGAVAPLAIPGAGAALRAAPILGNAALGAAQGISDTSLTQDKAEAAKEAAMGAGLGGAMGGAGKWFETFVPSAEKITAGNTAKMLGIQGHQLNRIIKGNPLEALGNIEDTMRSTVLPSGERLAAYSNDTMDLALKVREAVDMYGKRIGDITKSVNAKIPDHKLLQDLSDLETSASGLRVKSKALDTIKDIINENTDKKGFLSFDKLRDLRNTIWKKMIKYDPMTGRISSESVEPLRAWQYLGDVQNDIIQQANPSVFPAFAEANKHYSNLVGLQKALNLSALREDAKQTAVTLNPLSWLTALGKYSGKMTGADRLARNAPFMLNPAIRGAAKAIPENTQRAAQAAFVDFLTNRYGSTPNISSLGPRPQMPTSQQRATKVVPTSDSGSESAAALQYISLSTQLAPYSNISDDIIGAKAEEGDIGAIQILSARNRLAELEKKYPNIGEAEPIAKAALKHMGKMLADETGAIGGRPIDLAKKINNGTL